MKLIDRLYSYLENKGISPYAFERSCGLANGYLGKQLRVGGSVGSDILEKVGESYPDLSLEWLITGRGPMLVKPARGKKTAEADSLMLKEQQAAYKVRDKLIEVLKEQLEVLSSSMPPPSGKVKRPVKKRKPGKE